VQHRLCAFEAAHAGVGKWPQNFRKKTQGGPVLAAEETARELLAIRRGVPQPAVLFVSGYQGAWGVGWDGKRAGAAGGLFFGLVLG